MSVATSTRHHAVFEFTEDIAGLVTFLRIVILVCVDQLKVFATIEDSVVLVVRFSVPGDWIAREFDPELWPPLPSLNVELGMATDRRGEQPVVSPPPSQTGPPRGVRSGRRNSALSRSSSLNSGYRCTETTNLKCRCAIDSNSRSGFSVFPPKGFDRESGPGAVTRFRFEV